LTVPHKTLFLDFDGVLHSSICEPAQYFTRMPALEAVLRGTDVDIVVSSSWRFHHTWPSIIACFPKTLRPMVLGHTGKPVSGRHARWHEIRVYRERQGISDWRALDDSAFEFPPACPELILCDGALGVAVEQVQFIEHWIAK
jgi:hypothetical protein